MTIEANEPGRKRAPKLPWHGSCQCGQVRYTITEMPLTLYACHCSECQKQSSSAFGLSLRTRASAVSISGELADWSRPTALGSAMLAQFCPRCGSRMFHQRAQYAASPGGATINIKGGTLDCIGELEPVGHIWLKSRQKGTAIPHGLLEYDGQPENYDALMEAWSRQYHLQLEEAAQ
ncbi:MAG: GFA family protein [Nitratireductor sp.]